MYLLAKYISSCNAISWMISAHDYCSLPSPTASWNSGPVGWLIEFDGSTREAAMAAGLRVGVGVLL